MWWPVSMIYMWWPVSIVSKRWPASKVYKRWPASIAEIPWSVLPFAMFQSFISLSFQQYLLPSCAAGVSFTFSSGAFNLKLVWLIHGTWNLYLCRFLNANQICSNIWTGLQDIFNWCSERASIANISSVLFLILNLDKCQLWRKNSTSAWSVHDPAADLFTRTIGGGKRIGREGCSGWDVVFKRIIWERWGCYWQTVPPEWGGGRLFDGSTKLFLRKLL